MEIQQDKVCLVGYGYWGKILYNNLKQLNLNVEVYDNYASLETVLEEDTILDTLDNISCKDVFVAVPCNEHYNVVERLIKQGCNVFCEKPLTSKFKTSKDLYELAAECGVKLFVDWIFLYNDYVNYIKEVITTGKLGKLQTVNLYRQNKGPVRYDVSARVDLMSHDLSILLYMLGYRISKAEFFDYRRNITSEQFDSSIGILKFNDVTATIDVSWEYPIKNRLCLFEFEAGLLSWDDTTGEIFINNKQVKVTTKTSPLIRSINTFLNGKDRYPFRDITLKITELFENESKI